MFVRNPSGSDAVARLKGGGTLTLDRFETCALPQDATVAPGLKLAETGVRVLAVAQDGDTDDRRDLRADRRGRHSRPGRATNPCASSSKRTGVTARPERSGCTPGCRCKFPDRVPDGLRAHRRHSPRPGVGGQLGTGTLHLAGRRAGPAGGGGRAGVRGRASKTRAARLPCWSSGRTGNPRAGRSPSTGPGPRNTWRSGPIPAVDTVPAPGFEEPGRWPRRGKPRRISTIPNGKRSDDALQMGADGDTSAFAWYRAKVEHSPPPARARSTSSARTTWRCTSTATRCKEPAHHGDHWDFEVPLAAGKNTCSRCSPPTRGARRRSAHLGTLDDYHPKGLFGPATLACNGTRSAREKLADARRGRRGGVRDPTVGHPRRDKRSAHRVPHQFPARTVPRRSARTPSTA